MYILGLVTKCIPYFKAKLNTMVSINAARNLLITSCVLSCLAIGCFAAGIIGNVWWIIESSNVKTIRGLWQTCVELKNGTVCSKRDDIFTFNDKRGW